MEEENPSDFYLLKMEIDKLNKKIDDLTDRVDNSNKIIVSHINFIDKIFDQIKKPLFFITDRISNIFLLNDK